jgi:DNA/RNA endonuclease YhcR with UshA esterase domain
MKVGSDMKNPYIIPAAMICAAILAGFWMLKPTSEQPQKVIVVQRPDISIHKAAGEGNIEAVKQHLAAGTDVNAKLEGGTPPLSYAAFEGHKEVVELLIAAGADVNAKGADGKTPLDSADGETADIIRKHGGKTKKELEAEGK